MEPISQKRYARGFFIAALAYFVIFAASAAPIPLYSEYKLSIGLTDADISVAMATYLLGVLGILFFAGRISDALGRRTTTALACVLSAGGCVLFILVSSVPMLFVARFFQGLACGIAMSAISAWVVDCAKGKLAVFGNTIAGCGSLFGIAFGSIAVGFIRSVWPDFNITYCFIIALLALTFALLPLTPETVSTRQNLRVATKPNVGIDPQLRAVFPIAAAAYLSAWCVGAFYQSYCSPIAVDCLDTPDPVAASVILVLAMVPSAIGGPLEARFPSGTSLRLAMVLLLIAAFGSIVAMATAAFIPFLVCMTVFSVSMGMCLSGSLRLLFAQADGISTATVTSTINLIAYAACTVSSFATSALIPMLGLTGIMALLIVLSMFTSSFVFLKTRKTRN